MRIQVTPSKAKPDDPNNNDTKKDDSQIRDYVYERAKQVEKSEGDQSVMNESCKTNEYAHISHS